MRRTVAKRLQPIQRGVKRAAILNLRFLTPHRRKGEQTR